MRSILPRRRGVMLRSAYALFLMLAILRVPACEYGQGDDNGSSHASLISHTPAPASAPSAEFA